MKTMSNLVSLKAKKNLHVDSHSNVVSDSINVVNNNITEEGKNNLRENAKNNKSALLSNKIIQSKSMRKEKNRDEELDRILGSNFGNDNLQIFDYIMGKGKNINKKNGKKHNNAINNENEQNNYENDTQQKKQLQKLKQLRKDAPVRDDIVEKIFKYMHNKNILIDREDTENFLLKLFVRGEITYSEADKVNEKRQSHLKNMIHTKGINDYLKKIFLHDKMQSKSVLTESNISKFSKLLTKKKMYYEWTYSDLERTFDKCEKEELQKLLHIYYHICGGTTIFFHLPKLIYDKVEEEKKLKFWLDMYSRHSDDFKELNVNAIYNNDTCLIGQFHNTALHLYISEEQYSYAELFIDIVSSLDKKVNLDLNIRDIEGKTPFLLAIKMMIAPVSLIKKLITEKNYNLPDTEGFTPMMYAAMTRRVDIMKEIIACHLRVSVKDKKNIVDSNDNNIINNNQNLNVLDKPRKKTDSDSLGNQIFNTFNEHYKKNISKRASKNRKHKNRKNKKRKYCNATQNLMYIRDNANKYWIFEERKEDIKNFLNSQVHPRAKETLGHLAILRNGGRSDYESKTGKKQNHTLLNLAESVCIDIRRNANSRSNAFYIYEDGSPLQVEDKDLRDINSAKQKFKCNILYSRYTYSINSPLLYGVLSSKHNINALKKVFYTLCYKDGCSDSIKLLKQQIRNFSNFCLAEKVLSKTEKMIDFLHAFGLDFSLKEELNNLTPYDTLVSFKSILEKESKINKKKRMLTYLDKKYILNQKLISKVNSFTTNNHHSNSLNNKKTNVEGLRNRKNK